MNSFGDPKWSHLGTRNGPSWGPEMIPFEDSKLISFRDRFGGLKVEIGTVMNSFLDDQKMR